MCVCVPVPEYDDKRKPMCSLYRKTSYISRDCIPVCRLKQTGCGIHVENGKKICYPSVCACTVHTAYVDMQAEELAVASLLVDSGSGGESNSFLSVFAIFAHTMRSGGRISLFIRSDLSLCPPPTSPPSHTPLRFAASGEFRPGHPATRPRIHPRTHMTIQFDSIDNRDENSIVRRASLCCRTFCHGSLPAAVAMDYTKRTSEAKQIAFAVAPRDAAFEWIVGKTCVCVCECR